jgi:hypothetical protein
MTVNDYVELDRKNFMPYRRRAWVNTMALGWLRDKSSYFTQNTIRPWWRPQCKRAAAFADEFNKNRLSRLGPFGEGIVLLYFLFHNPVGLAASVIAL